MVLDCLVGLALPCSNCCLAFLYLITCFPALPPLFAFLALLALLALLVLPSVLTCLVACLMNLLFGH